MRPLRFMFFALAHATLVLAPSGALARPIAFGATLAIEIDVNGRPLRFQTRSTGVAEVSGSGGVRTALTLAASEIRGTTSRLVTDSLLAPIEGQTLDVANATGSFGIGQQGLLAGRMALRGTAKLCIFYRCDDPGAGEVPIPLSAVGATATRTVMADAGILLTVLGSAWSAGSFGGGLSGTSSPLTLSLLTPIFISTNLGAFPVLRGYSRLTLNFAEPIPEPHTFALLGGGVAALAAGARRARTRRAG